MHLEKSDGPVAYFGLSFLNICAEDKTFGADHEAPLKFVLWHDFDLVSESVLLTDLAYDLLSIVVKLQTLRAHERQDLIFEGLDINQPYPHMPL